LNEAHDDASGLVSIEDNKDSAAALAQTFAAWVDPDSNSPPPLVMAGAGLSYPLAPLAFQLATEVAQRQRTIEDALGIDTQYIIKKGKAETLYEWADKAISALGGTDAKSRLAQAMGLTTDERFLAHSGVGPRGTTARHRVLARLAREGRIRAVWSFNWDCWLEASFEAVGMRRRAGLQPLQANVGWQTRYDVWFNAAAPQGETDCQPLFKAHGCIEALHNNEGDFVIQKSEMGRPLKRQNADRRNRLRDQINQPGGVVAFGWAASERYVVALFMSHKPQLHTALTGALTIVDRVPSNPRHLRIASNYPGATHTPRKVESASPGTTDDLMLWIQTLRGLRTMGKVCCAQSAAPLSELESTLPPFTDARLRDTWFVSFFDDWLPIWLRTCCLSLVETLGIADGKVHQVLPSDRRDAHIPWCNPLNPRSDLRAALALLTKLHQLHRAAPAAVAWDFDTFPGGLWDPARSHLVLPVPVWAAPDDRARIALRPLIESIHWQSKARIRSAQVLALDHAQAQPDPNTGRLEAGWREAVASCFQHAALAEAGQVGTCRLDDLTLPTDAH
jgi:hypothetical protein